MFDVAGEYATLNDVSQVTWHRHVRELTSTGKFGLALGLLLFALESSTNHLLMLLQISDLRLTTPLWLSTIALYAAAGALAGVVVVLPFVRVSDERGRALRRGIVVATLTAVYAAVLHVYRIDSLEWTPLAPPVLFAIIAWSSVVAQFVCWPRSARPAPGIQAAS